MAIKNIAKANQTKTKMAKGTSFVCDSCGLSVKVDKPCCCTESHDIMCCGQPMRECEPEINESGNA